MRIIADITEKETVPEVSLNSVHFVGNVTLTTLPNQHGSSALFTKTVSLYKSETATQSTLLNFKQISFQI